MQRSPPPWDSRRGPWALPWPARGVGWSRRTGRKDGGIMSHLDEGTLHALLDGELDITEVSEVQTHLGTCAACGSRLQEVKQFLAESDRLVATLEIPAAAAPQPPRQPSP